MRSQTTYTSRSPLPQPANPIRVFLLEDYPGALEIFAQTLATTPDLLYVGGHTYNSSDLPERVCQSQADVVIVDLVLTTIADPEDARRHPETWGITAIESLRRYCAPTLKLIAYSNWPYLRQEALAATADAFLSKRTSVETLFDTIRQVVAREVPHP